MERHGIAIVVEDAGVQVQQPQPRRVERQALLMARFAERQAAAMVGKRREHASPAAIHCISSGGLDAERRNLGINENKVEEGLVEASTTCGPELAEILVTSHKETTNHGIHEVDTKVEVEQTSAMEQSVACEPVDVTLPELDGEECTANEAQKCQGLEKNAPQEEQNDMLCTPDGEVKCHSPKQTDSQDEELVDAVINNKSNALHLSTDSNTGNSQKGSSVIEAVEVISSSRALKKRVSIMDLNAVVKEQLTKCLHALEQNMIPGKAEHRRAIILATLVAIIVWARNAKHLHESMPRIRCSTINVHIRSRL